MLEENALKAGKKEEQSPQAALRINPETYFLCTKTGKKKTTRASSVRSLGKTLEERREETRMVPLSTFAAGGKKKRKRKTLPGGTNGIEK